MANPKEGAGSDKAELKKLLRVAHDQPVNVAFALGADGKALIKMDKMKQPRALEKLLKEEAGSKNHRFGTVIIDPEDSKLARFSVNKAGGGFARKLAVALKGTGISKVALSSEDGETEQAEEAQEEEAQGEAPAPAAAAPAGNEEAVDPALQRKLAKAGQVWDATVAKIVRDVDQLVAEAVKAGRGHALADGLDTHVRHAAAPLLQTLNGNMSRLLEGAASAKDEAARGKLLEGARREAEQLKAFVEPGGIASRRQSVHPTGHRQDARCELVRRGRRHSVGDRHGIFRTAD